MKRSEIRVGVSFLPGLRFAPSGKCHCPARRQRASPPPCRRARCKPAGTDRAQMGRDRNAALASRHHRCARPSRYACRRRSPTFSVRRYRRAALCAPCASLGVVLRVRCVVPDAVLRAPRVVPDAVLRAPRVVLDAAPCQTSVSQWTAWRAWCWSALQHLTQSALQVTTQVRTQPRIQKEQERFDDRPASVPNVHPCQAPGLLPSCRSHKFQRAGIDLNQPDRLANNGD
jgi:hypothetical protein